jgi:hypothetical protein
MTPGITLSRLTKTPYSRPPNAKAKCSVSGRYSLCELRFRPGSWFYVQQQQLPRFVLNAPGGKDSGVGPGDAALRSAFMHLCTGGGFCSFRTYIPLFPESLSL